VVDDRGLTNLNTIRRSLVDGLLYFS